MGGNRRNNEGAMVVVGALAFVGVLIVTLIGAVASRIHYIKETNAKKNERSGGAGPSSSRRSVETNQKCLVCDKAMEDDTSVLECGHEFHRKCLKMMFASPSVDKVCPSPKCQKPVPVHK